MRDPSELERSLNLYKGLVEVSALINAITDFDEVLTAILDIARRVADAEASSLFLVDDQGDLRLTIARGPAGEVIKAHTVIPRGHGVAGWVLENGRSALVPDAYADPRFYSDVDKRSGFKTRSIICVPLTRGESHIGVLQVLNPIGRESFNQTELEVFEAFANLASAAIARSRAVLRQREQERMQRELSLAYEIQMSFLPQTLPVDAAVAFAAAYQPARTVGGDFYDVIRIGPDEIYFVIGDVSGKGVPAALLMAQSLSMLRLIIQPEIPPGKALALWNDMLTGRTIRGMFITALVGRVTPSQGRVELANAGHCAPFHVTAGAGAADVALDGGLPLGILPERHYPANSVGLNPGESLVFFTDGLSESFDPNDVPLDREGIVNALNGASNSPGDLVEELQNAAARHRQSREAQDDLTLLVCGFQ